MAIPAVLLRHLKAAIGDAPREPGPALDGNRAALSDVTHALILIACTMTSAIGSLYAQRATRRKLAELC